MLNFLDESLCWILLKFNTENKFFQYDAINIPDFNVLQRKIPAQIVWICSGCWKQGTSSACFVMFSYFLVIVLIWSITGRGAPVYLLTTRGQTFQSATNTGRMCLWAQADVRSRGRRREAGQGRDAALAGDAELQGHSLVSWEPGQEGRRTRCSSLALLRRKFLRSRRVWGRFLPLSGALNSAASSWYPSSQGGAKQALPGWCSHWTSVHYTDLILLCHRINQGEEQANPKD